MSQVTQTGSEPMIMDPYEIGWYIESADEEIYGPVSRQSLRRFLEDQTITPNTLVRHCTQPEARPAADQPAIMEQFQLEARGSVLGDKLSERWPRKTRDRQALAEGALPCAWHKRPAVLVCVRCHAPYCGKCRTRPPRKQFFLCRRCQTSVYNRRAVAAILDTLLIVYGPLFVVWGVLLVAGGGQALVAVSYAVNAGSAGFMLVRDSLFRGAGIGKRAMGLRAVKTSDGKTPLSHGQGVIRWLSMFIPFFNLVDLSVPFRDPLLRRFGDRWAGTRVIETEQKVVKARQKLAQRLIKKGVQPAPVVGMTMEGFARLA